MRKVIAIVGAPLAGGLAVSIATLLPHAVDVSDNDLQEQAQILSRFQPISEFVSFTDSKNKNEAQITYQSFYIGIHGKNAQS